MLYKIKAGVSIFETNPELHAIPEFDALLEKQLLVVALVADKRSPLRTLPEKQRREKACIIAGYPLEGNRPNRNAREIINGNTPSIEAAIAKYREYQWDEKQDTLDTMKAQLHEIKEFLKSDKTKAKDYSKELERAAKLSHEIPKLEEDIQKLEGLLRIKSDEAPEIQTYTPSDLPETEGSEELSLLDQVMSKQQKQ